jgi:hypothetical protein
MKRVITSLFLLFIVNNVFSQDFFRVIELSGDKMYGSDIIRLQTILKNHGFDEVGEIDGFYGPLTESVIKNIQYYLGYEQNGVVDIELWNFLFNESNKVILENISTISKYNINELERKRENRMGYSTEGGYVDKYLENGEVKIIKLHLFGEIYQVEWYFYNVDLDYYFIVEKYYRYPYHLFDFLEDRNDFWEKTIIEYTTYLKNNSELFQIINGDFIETNFDLNNLLYIIENNREGW